MASRLLQELQQTKPFPRPQDEALVAVLRTAAVLEHQLGEALKAFGLTLTQFNVLRILRGAGAAGLCGREIGERLIAQVPDVPRLLERMEAAGLLDRARDREDRRHVSTRITPEGRRLLERAEAALEPIARRRFRGLQLPEIQALLAALDAIRAEG